MHLNADLTKVPFPRFRVSADGTIVGANGPFAALLAVTDPGDLVGRAPGDYLVDRRVWDDLTGADGGSIVREALLRRVDGHTVRAALGVSRAADDGGWDAVALDLGADERTEEPLIRAFRASGLGIALVGADQRPILVNDALLDMLGMTEDEFLAGAPDSIMAAEEVADARLRVDALVAGALDHYEVERCLFRKDGGKMWVIANAAALRDDEGRFEAMLTQFVDVTGRKQSEEALEKSQSQFRALLDAIPDLMFRIDGDGYIRWWRPARDFDAAMAPAEFLGKHISDVHPEMADTWIDVFARVMITGRSELVGYEWGDGSFEAQVTSISGEEILVLIRDVTARQAMRRQLEELVQAKDEMVATVSHELRTPLTSVVGFAEELYDGWDQLEPEDARRMVQVVRDQSREMAELVDDLLVAARGDIGMLRVEPQRLDVGDEVRGVLEVWRGSAVAVVEPDGPVIATADRVRLRQIMRNLLRNAERHGHGPVSIELAQAAEGATVRVVDSGPGLPEGEWELIFDPYYRAYEPGEGPGTFGLGLTISRMLAWLMDGDLVYAVDGGRSTFELTLPAG